MWAAVKVKKPYHTIGFHRFRRFVKFYLVYAWWALCVCARAQAHMAPSMTSIDKTCMTTMPNDFRTRVSAHACNLLVGPRAISPTLWATAFSRHTQVGSASRTTTGCRLHWYL